VSKENEKYHDLKVIMFARKVTQADLADMLNVSEQTVNAKLNGRGDFTIEEAEKIIEELEIENPTAIFFKSVLRGT